MERLQYVDPEVAKIITDELHRQANTLELIASENHVSLPVLEAMGSVLTDKYAEGYPGRRYYCGCENMDAVEQLAIDRAKQLFGAEHANVQPHSGTSANLAVYLAAPQARRQDHGHGPRPRRAPLARHGDQPLGHVLQGRPATACARTPRRLDMDAGPRAGPAASGPTCSSPARRPIRGRSTSRPSARSPSEVGCLLMADIAHIAGLVVGGRAPRPGAAQRLRHHHHAQDAPRPARRHDPVPRPSGPRRSTRPSSPASRAGR